MIGGQLRDRARVVRKDKSPVRVAGGYQTTESFGPWFRCGLDSGREDEARSAGGVRQRRAGMQLVAGRRALDGTEVELRASDELQIDSHAHGMLRVDVTATPERVMRGRTWTGWIANLDKVSRSSA